MNLAAGTERNRQLATVGVGTVLTLILGLVLLAGFRVATQMRTNITALQTASTLTTYPAAISQQLNSLRDRLEARAYAGQALSDLKATVKRFDQDLEQLGMSGAVESPDLDQALLLWHQYGPVINPVVTFTGQPYLDTDEGGSSFSREGKTHYADVKRAQLFASDNAQGLQTRLATVAATLQDVASTDSTRLRFLLSVGVLVAVFLAAAAAYFQAPRARHERAAKDSQQHPPQSPE